MKKEKIETIAYEERVILPIFEKSNFYLKFEELNIEDLKKIVVKIENNKFNENIEFKKMQKLTIENFKQEYYSEVFAQRMIKKEIIRQLYETILIKENSLKCEINLMDLQNQPSTSGYKQKLFKI